MGALVEDLRFRGLVNQVTDDSVFDRLDAGAMTAYIGFDPSASSLGVGNLVQLCTLSRLQAAGNKPIALAGGGTGFIGDPSMRSEDRNLLDLGELESNLEGISPQLKRFLDFSDLAGKSRAILANNASWLGQIGLLAFLREIGTRVTVNAMIRKESVRSRIEREGQGISFSEFSYMLLQAYDFVMLHEEHGCDLQLGGSDQWGN
ncbi:MAG: tyrosine--tRNA ligase, partial [Acidimicrobiales bacterium]